MRIGIFMHQFDGGGAERMTVILANALHEAGQQITFLVRSDIGESRYLLNPEVPVLDLKLTEMSKIKKNWKNIRQLRKVLKRAEYDVLLSITAEMSQVASLAAIGLKKRIPLIQVLHNTLSMETHSYQRFREKLYPIFDKQFNKVIAVSNGVRDDYLKVTQTSPARVVTIYNPVIYPELYRLAGLPNDHPWLDAGRTWHTLVLSGRLSYQKNHYFMLKVIKQLQQAGDYRLILLGIGELESELKAACRILEIEDVVDFYGYTENPYSFYRLSDAVVLCSRYEGLPTVLIEALACESRIVSVNCRSGPEEILEGGKHGILVPVGDETEFVAAVLKTVQSKPDIVALQRRARDFSLDHAVHKYLKVIKELKTEHKGFMYDK